jgi:mannosyltransferase OCH1-like enzyme
MTNTPLIIHQTWKSTVLPPPFDELSESWKKYHPHWKYILWTDEMNRDFIKEHYPAFLSKYDQYPKNIQRVDAFRYCVLNKFGGLYVDMDFECLENIEPLLAGHECIIGKEPQLHADRFSKEMILCNAFMACAPDNEFMNFVCDKIISAPMAEVNSAIDILNSTGPFILTDCYLEFTKKDKVKIIESADIYPITMFETVSVLKENIPEEIQSRIDKAYAIHYFLGCW